MNEYSIDSETKNYNLPTIEIMLFACIILLIGIGFGFLYSASEPSGLRYHNSQYYYLIRQGIYLVIGLGLFFAGFFIDHKFYLKNIKWIILVTIIFLILTLIPGVSKEVGGARRWISLFRFQFQPSEVAKLTIILYLSSVLSNKQEYIKDFYKGVFPPLILTFFICFLIFIENDFSTTFILIFIIFIMYFLAGIRIITLLMLMLLSGISGFLMIFFAPYRINRFFAFLDPWKDPLKSGWHYLQSMKCFALGKWFGRGIGESTQKYYALPEAHNDYIYAIIGEEGGALIALVILLLYTILAFIGFNIAKRCEDKNSYLTACGITALIYLQAIINIGVVLSVLPATGITLPFISAGGTSLVTFMFAVGILFNISYSTKKKLKKGIK